MDTLVSDFQKLDIVLKATSVKIIRFEELSRNVDSLVCASFLKLQLAFLLLNLSKNYKINTALSRNLYQNICHISSSKKEKCKAKK
jgi:hypothetical protein